MLSKLRKIAEKYFGVKVKMNLQKIDVKNISASRETCRNLKQTGGLILLTKKGSTRHKKVKCIVKKDKKLWIDKVRKLRRILRVSKLKLNTRIYRSAYKYIKSNKLDTKNKLNNYLKMSLDKESVNEN
jgi:ribosomal protein L19E